jgi:hypothetical protein
MADAAASVMDPESSARWNKWIDGRLETERAEVLDIITKAMGEFASEYTHEKLAPLKAEIADLKRTLVEREERVKAIAEVKRELVGERVEREALQLSAALAARDARIAGLEDRLQMLLRFLSLSGYDLPRGM